MCNSSRYLFCVGVGDNFEAKSNKTVPVKTAKPNFVAFLVFTGTVALLATKICSSPRQLGIVNKEEWLGSPANIKGVNKDAKI